MASAVVETSYESKSRKVAAPCPLPKYRFPAASASDVGCRRVRASTSVRSKRLRKSDVKAEVCPVRECSVVLERLPSDVVCGKRVSCSSLSSSASCANVRVNDDNSDVECVSSCKTDIYVERV